MELIQITKVITYQILADYTKISKESPLISILKVCKELGNFELSELKDFLEPLNHNAVSNLLSRLENLGYIDTFESYSEDIFELTQKGLEVCEHEKIEEEYRGILKMTVAYPNKTSAIIVKLEPLNKDSFQETEKTESNASREFRSLTNNSQALKNGTFDLKKIEGIYILEKESRESYTFTFDKDSYTAELLDYSKLFNDPKHKVINELLANAYKSTFDEKEQLIRLPFNRNNLSLKRKIFIKNPKYDGLFFNETKLEEPIQISPIDEYHAKEWFMELVISRISNHFFSDDDFNAFTNEIAEEFVEYNEMLPFYISKPQLITQLSEPEHFYKRAKLDTINHLNY